MSKTIGFKKPISPEEQFVARGKEQFNTDSEPIKRLTLDLPVSLHKALKRKAIDEDQTMRNMVLMMIQEKLKS